MGKGSARKTPCTVADGAAVRPLGEAGALRQAGLLRAHLKDTSRRRPWMLTLLALYGGLFLTALVAATLLPAQSELLLATLLVQSGEPAWALITVATLGNSAGSAVNWWLGRYLTRFQDRRWFPFSPESLRKAEGWYHRYGRWTLLCSWMPVIGDPLTLVAGTLREPLPSFLLLVVLAKLGRYLAVAGVALAIW